MVYQLGISSLVTAQSKYSKFKTNKQLLKFSLWFIENKDQIVFITYSLTLLAYQGVNLCKLSSCSK